MNYIVTREKVPLPTGKRASARGKILFNKKSLTKSGPEATSHMLHLKYQASLYLLIINILLYLRDVAMCLCTATVWGGGDKNFFYFAYLPEDAPTLLGE